MSPIPLGGEIILHLLFDRVGSWPIPSMLAIGPLATAGASAKVMVASVGEIDHQQAVMVVIGNSELSWGYRRESAMYAGVDCAMGLRGAERLCVDLVERPASVKRLFDRAFAEYPLVYQHFDAMLKAHGQSISEEIRVLPLQAAQRMLSDSNMTIQQIARDGIRYAARHQPDVPTRSRHVARRVPTKSTGRKGCSSIGEPIRLPEPEGVENGRTMDGTGRVAEWTGVGWLGQSGEARAACPGRPRGSIEMGRGTAFVPHAFAPGTQRQSTPLPQPVPKPKS